MDDIFNTNPLVSTLVCSLIGLLLIDNLTAREQATFGNWLMLISQTMLTNASSQSIIEERALGTTININSKEAKKKYHPIKYNICELKKVLKEMDVEHGEDTIDQIQEMIKKIQEEINSIKKEIL